MSGIYDDSALDQYHERMLDDYTDPEEDIEEIDPMDLAKE